MTLEKIIRILISLASKVTPRGDQMVYEAFPSPVLIMTVYFYSFNKNLPFFLPEKKTKNLDKHVTFNNVRMSG